MSKTTTKSKELSQLEIVERVMNMDAMAKKILEKCLPKGVKVKPLKSKIDTEFVYSIDLKKIAPVQPYLKQYNIISTRRDFKYTLTISYDAKLDEAHLGIKRIRKAEKRVRIQGAKERAKHEGYKKFESDFTETFINVCEDFKDDIFKVYRTNIKRFMSVLEEARKVSGKEMCFVRDLPEAIYHECKELSNSDMTRLEISWEEYLRKIDRTEAMAVGAGFHCYTLTPKLFKEQFHVKPEDLTKVGSEGKMRSCAFELASVGREIISAKNFEVIKDGAKKLKNHPLAEILMRNIEDTELTLFSKDKETGVNTRARLDLIVKVKEENKEDLKIVRRFLLASGYIKKEDEFHADDKLYIDFKFLRAVTTGALTNETTDKRYYRQAAHYVQLAKEVYDPHARFFLFLNIKKEGNERDIVFSRVVDTNDQGMTDRRDLMNKYKLLKNEENLWKGMNYGIVNIPVLPKANFQDKSKVEDTNLIA